MSTSRSHMPRVHWLFRGALASIAGGLFSVLGLSALAHSPLNETQRTLAAGAGVTVLLGLMLWLAHRATVRNVRQATLRVLRAAKRPGPLRLQPSGWDSLDRLSAAYLRVLRGRDLRLKALEREAARYREMADTAQSIEALFDARGRLLWVNRAIESLTGFSRLDCTLSPHLQRTLVSREDQSAAAALRQRMREQAYGEGAQLRLRCKDGGPIWVHLAWHHVLDEQGRYWGLRVSGLAGPASAETRRLPGESTAA